MKALNRTSLMAAVAGLFAASLTASTAWAGTSYTVTDLGALGGIYSDANSINDSGQVVGRYYASFGAYIASRAFLYSGSTMTDLGTFGGTNSEAVGINNSGQVVGYFVTTGVAAYHAFLYSGSTMTDLGTLGGSGSWARGINNSGQVVGEAWTAGNAAYHAFLYSASTMTDLGTLGGSYSGAQGINNSGQVVGWSTTAGDAAWHAFIYSGSTMTDLGTLGGSGSWAQGINNSAQVVGCSTTAGDAVYHAFLYSGSTMTDLGTLGGGRSGAFGINASGQVVGFSTTTGDAAYHAFLYSGSTMTDLNNLIATAPGWTITAACAINNVGQIAGNATTPNGETHAVLLTPTVASPKTYVLSVGVRDAGSNHGGDINAQRVADAFGQFPNAATPRVLKLSTADANNTGLIKAQINQVGRQVKPGDTIVFYINSHGMFDLNGDEVAVDAQNDPKHPSHRISTTGDERLYLSRTNASDRLSDDDFRACFTGQEWEGVKKLFIMDTCYANGWWGSTTQGDSGDLNGLDHAAIIAASTEGDFSYATMDASTGLNVGNLGAATVAALNALSGQEKISFQQLYDAISSKGKVFEGTHGFIQDLEDNWIDPVVASFDATSLSSGDFDWNSDVVPEPATLSLLALGGVTLIRRKR